MSTCSTPSASPALAALAGKYLTVELGNDACAASAREIAKEALQSISQAIG